MKADIVTFNPDSQHRTGLQGMVTGEYRGRSFAMGVRPGQAGKRFTVEDFRRELRAMFHPKAAMTAHVRKKTA